MAYDMHIICVHMICSVAPIMCNMHMSRQAGRQGRQSLAITRRDTPLARHAKTCMHVTGQYHDNTLLPRQQIFWGGAQLAPMLCCHTAVVCHHLQWDCFLPDGIPSDSHISTTMTHGSHTPHLPHAALPCVCQRWPALHHDS